MYKMHTVTLHFQKNAKTDAKHFHFMMSDDWFISNLKCFTFIRVCSKKHIATILYDKLKQLNLKLYKKTF